MNKRRALVAAIVCGVISSAGTALADYVYRDGNGSLQTIFTFVCQSTKLCPAQVLIDSSGNEKATTANPLIVAGPGYTPVSPMQSALPTVTATPLTVPQGPTPTIYAVVCASGAPINYSTDGTTLPTSSVGMPLAAGSCLPLVGAAVIANFKAIQQSAAALLNVSYFR